MLCNIVAQEERLEEVRALRKVDEELCGRLGMDPFYISTSNVPNPVKLLELKVSVVRWLVDISFINIR